VLSATSLDDVEENFIYIRKNIRQIPKHRYDEIQMLLSYKRASLLSNSLEMNIESDTQNIFELLMLWKEVEKLARKYNQQDFINESVEKQALLKKMLP
jgi:hypothetical protein